MHTFSARLAVVVWARYLSFIIKRVTSLHCVVYSISVWFSVKHAARAWQLGGVTVIGLMLKTTRINGLWKILEELKASRIVLFTA